LNTVIKKVIAISFCLWDCLLSSGYQGLYPGDKVAREWGWSLTCT